MKQERTEWIDSLKALAVLMVIIGHIMSYIDSNLAWPKIVYGGGYT